MQGEGAERFTGPLFIVGMPRSGTKLLRGLLMEHPDIGIPDIETEFYPYLATRARRYGDLSQPRNFARLYRDITRFPYFIYRGDQGRIISAEAWHDLCRDYTAAGLFEALVRHDAGIPFGSTAIWGDKSPSYIAHTSLLLRDFPDARFIHIVRDVRDYCLSINQAWGKNMLRAASRWSDGVSKLQVEARLHPERYLVLMYESLTRHTEQELQRICDFLGVEFRQEMLRLSAATENLGDTRGEKRVVTNNIHKYKIRMDPVMLKRIEALAKPVLESCGYEVGYDGAVQRIPPLRMLYYQVLDAAQLIRSEMSRRGLWGAIRFHLRYFRVTRT